MTSGFGNTEVIVNANKNSVFGLVGLKGMTEMGLKKDGTEAIAVTDLTEVI